MAATLSFHLREHWGELKRGRPGHRFEQRYERVHRSGGAGHLGQRLIAIVIALVCWVIAAFLSVLPGPALPFFFIGGGLLATESRTIARFMDHCEIWLRRLLAWGKRVWRRLSLPLRVVVVIAAVALSVTGAFVSFHLLRG